MIAQAATSASADMNWVTPLLTLAGVIVSSLCAVWIAKTRRDLKPNGMAGTQNPPGSGNVGDALARIEQRQVTAETAIAAAIARDDGRFSLIDQRLSEIELWRLGQHE